MRKVIEAGICGVEIGLPIDKENCEGTDVGGVATPTGSLKQKPNTKELFEEDKEKEENKKEEPKDNSGMVCPECGSKNVNVHNKDDEDVFFCTDCNYKWSVEDADDNGKKDSVQDRKEIQGNIISKLDKKKKDKENENSKNTKEKTKDKGGKKVGVKEGMELSKRFKVGKEYSTKGNKTFIIKKVVGNNVQIYDVDAGENVIVKAEFLNKLENVREV